MYFLAVHKKKLDGNAENFGRDAITPLWDVSIINIQILLRFPDQILYHFGFI